MLRNLTNVLLGLAVMIALLTGVTAFGTGSPAWGWALAVAHGVVGLVIVVLAGRKSRVVGSGWRAGRTSRWGGAALGVVTVLTVASGVAQSVGWWRLGPVTAIQVHVPSAVAAGVGVVWHAIVHPGPWRALRRGRVVASRRAALRTLGIGGLALVTWGGIEAAAVAVGGLGGRRRFTGSHRLEEPLVTQWFLDTVPMIDPDTWRVAIEDADGRREVDLTALATHPSRVPVVAVLDCTGGWWAETTWEGVPLAALVVPREGDRSVDVVSVTGYVRRFPLADLDRLVLATSLDGRALPSGHGAPARLVAPGRRGFWWVKWVVAVRTSPTHWPAQPPFPLT